MTEEQENPAMGGRTVTAGRIEDVGLPTRRSTYLPFGQPHFGDEEIAAVTRVLRSGWVGLGPETIAFEEELAGSFGAPHVVAVNSCTSALFLSLLVHGVGAGDEVIVPSLTWISTANAARHLGATPVFCDIHSETMCVTPATVRARLTPRTKAVVVVHLGGLAVDVEAIRRAIPSHIAIVEDAAHACGARFADGTAVGSSGNLTCFSFYANKNLSTGDGGAIALADGRLADRLRSLRQHALPNDAWKRFIDARSLGSTAIDEVGYKMNYTDLQAAIGRVQLRRQPEFAVRRLAVARTYAERLASLPWAIPIQSGVLEPAHARHLFLVQLPIGDLAQSRDDILSGLRDRNIGASIHYQPVHTMPLYARGRADVLPVTDHVASRILTLPISASMSVADARQAIAALADVVSTQPVRQPQLKRSVG
jgi:dTDP-4-amino-4,6-dideoxygalactose transaminase